MVRLAAAFAVAVLFLAGCGPTTGINSAACSRAQDETRMASSQLQDALATQARAAGGVSSEAADAMVEIATERAQRASEEIDRACELGITEDNASAPAPATVAEAAPGPNMSFVNVEVTEERSEPGGGVVENRIYRGQRVEVTDRRGAWVRVTGLEYTPRWVRASHLSLERPAPLPQPDLAPDLMDARIQGIPAVGEEGHSEADVRALRVGAAHLLASGQCRQIEIGSKSVNRDGVYWVNCGENSNRFFTMRDGEPRFCGRSASSC